MPMNDFPSNLRIAIAVQKYFHPGQTFVNRHLRHLFGGNSCVISERIKDKVPQNLVDRPVFCIGKELLNVRDMLTAPFFVPSNYLKHSVLRVPYGVNRKRLINFLKKQRVDVMLSEFGSQSMLIADVAKETGIPAFCYFRGRDASYWLSSPSRIKAYKKVFENLDGVFAVSQFLLDNLAAKGICHPNSHAVPSGTDIDIFKPGLKDRNLCVSVGRFVDKKYPQLAVRSFLKATEGFPNARFEMIGKGPALRQCQKLVKDAQAERKVIFHGNRPPEFVAERLSRAAFFVQHSVIDKTGEAEGLPSSIQEAMAAGCAIVSTRHAGIPELVEEGLSGYLSDELDESDFAELIKSAFENPQKTLEMGISARAVAEQKVDYRLLYAHVEQVMRASVLKRKMPR